MLAMMMSFGGANLPIRCNVTLVLTRKLPVTLLTGPFIQGPVKKVQFLATYASGFQSVGFRSEVGRRVNCFAAQEMPPKKKLRQSSLVKDENQSLGAGKAKAEDEDQRPDSPRARKLKPSSAVKEEDEHAEAKPGGRPPLNYGVHPGTLPYQGIPSFADSVGLCSTCNPIHVIINNRE